MTWLKIDDTFCRNPKIHRLTSDAFRLHLAALCYCAAHLTDGVIHRQALPVIQSDANVGRKWRIHTTLLVDSGLWEQTDSGYVINDYLDYNPSKANVEAKREADAERQRRWRENNLGNNGVTSTPRHGVTNSAPSRPLNTYRGNTQKPVENSPVRGAYCHHCQTRLAPGLYLEDHLRLNHPEHVG